MNAPNTETVKTIDKLQGIVLVLYGVTRITNAVISMFSAGSFWGFSPYDAFFISIITMEVASRMVTGKNS